MEQFIFFVGIVWLAVLSPGPDFAMVSQLSFSQGRKAGLMAAAGIALACWFHVFYAVFGLGLIQAQFPQFLTAVKILGVLYLVYIGVRIALSAPVRLEDALAQSRPGSGIAAFATGVLTNGLNPKTAIFVVSVYVQIIGPETSLAHQLGYGAIISLSHLVWFAAVALFLSQSHLRSFVLARQQIFNRAIGAALVALGVMLALSDLSQSVSA
jgi:threonine/homoserine/homoserine lactone efflux protein